MEKAYIILAHKHPAQLLRLITALDDHHATFFLHLDKHTDASLFGDIEVLGEKVVMVERVATKWGSFELVTATLNAMQAVQRHHKIFDFISLISGQHYPIQSNASINSYLAQGNSRIFLEYTLIPDYHRWKPRGGLYRIDKYFFGLTWYEKFAAKAFNFVSGTTGIFKRSIPQNMKHYGGSQWWTMDAYALDYILRFVDENPAFSRFHRFTFAPDELFHTILLNAEDELIQSRIANNNLLYLSWEGSPNGHPVILKSTDIQKVLTSKALFARKFDIGSDVAVLDLIDMFRNGDPAFSKTVVHESVVRQQQLNANQ